MKHQRSNEKAPAFSPGQSEIAAWLKRVKFKKRLFGGVDEADVWRKIEELNALYEKLLLLERGRQDAGEADE